MILMEVGPCRVGVDLEPPLPPNAAAEPTNCSCLSRFREPTEIGGPLESLRGEASRRAMGQMSLASAQHSARAPEGKTPIGEAHGCPPDLPDPQTHSSVIWEPESVGRNPAEVRAHQARGAVVDEGARTRLNTWPSPSVVIVNLDTCSG